MANLIWSELSFYLCLESLYRLPDTLLKIVLAAETASVMAHEEMKYQNSQLAFGII